MMIRTKLVLLEAFSGIFGWIWLLSIPASIYFLVRAIGFGGSWLVFAVAFVAGAIGKALCASFNSERRRVASLAESEGLWPPQDQDK